MDDADRAGPAIDITRQMALERIQAEPVLPFKGRCHYCDESVAESLRFCNADCRDDFSKEKAALRRAGR